MKYHTALQRVDYADQHGDNQACERFNINLESLNRYKRTVRAIEEGPQKLPNILLFDIETSPMMVYVWGLYKQRINHDNVIEDWHVISWSAKWLFSGEILSDVLTPEEAKAHDDTRVVKSIWRLFETADIVVAHNAKRFDIRKLNARWMLTGLKPPSSYQVIDTLTESRKIAAHSSHRLDFLGKIISNKGKIATDFGLWKKCYIGDPESLKYMEKYNKEDVVLLEEVYLFLRGWIKSHPNVGLYMDIEEPVCTNCGSDKLTPLDEYVTQVGAYSTFRCSGCGGICRQRQSNLIGKKKKRLVVSVAK